jgi:hypothetical protein
MDNLETMQVLVEVLVVYMDVVEEYIFVDQPTVAVVAAQVVILEQEAKEVYQYKQLQHQDVVVAEAVEQAVMQTILDVTDIIHVITLVAVEVVV